MAQEYCLFLVGHGGFYDEHHMQCMSNGWLNILIWFL